MACTTSTKHARDVVKEIPQVDGSPSEKILQGFTDKTKEYGLSGVKAVHLYTIDFDSDGYTDLVTLPDFYSIPEFYRFDPILKTFYLIESPLPSALYASFLTFFDFDNDGQLEMLLASLNQKSAIPDEPLRLFKRIINNNVFKYEELKGVLPYKYPTAGVAVTDYDLDGKLDLYISNWYNTEGKTVTLSQDLLLQNDGKGFLNRSEILPHEIQRPSFGAAACDLNKDGFSEILVAATSGHKNLLLQKTQDFFQDIASTAGVDEDSERDGTLLTGGNTQFIDCFDYNNDGHFDLFIGEISHSYDPLVRDRSSILTSKGPFEPLQFLRTEIYVDDGTPNWSEALTGMLSQDFDLDGKLDLIVENSGFPPKSRLIFFHQQPDREYVDEAKSYGIDILNPSGLATFDVNNDQQPDLIVGQNSLRTNLQKRVYLFENNFKSKETIPFTIQLRGKKANKNGVGATLRFFDGEEWIYRYTKVVSGALPSQSDGLSYFSIKAKNLGKAKLEVKWPSLLASQKKPSFKNYQIKEKLLLGNRSVTIVE